MASLICKLKRPVFTEDGDFIPAGTPVTVMGFSGNDDAGVTKAGPSPRIEVSAWAAVVPEAFTPGDARTAAVVTRLSLAVDPDNLVYEESHSD